MRGKITAGARREIALTIADYQDELVPLGVPIRLIAHYVRLHGLHFWRASPASTRIRVSGCCGIPA